MATVRDLGKKNVIGILVDAVDYEAAVEKVIAAATERRGYAVSALALRLRSAGDSRGSSWRGRSLPSSGEQRRRRKTRSQAGSDHREPPSRLSAWVVLARRSSHTSIATRCPCLSSP